MDPYAAVGLRRNTDDSTQAMDPYATIGLGRNTDGSFTRTQQIPKAPPSPDSKDVTLNSVTNTSLRLFLPPNAAALPKLPVIIYAPGGGFVIHGPFSGISHQFCSAVAGSTPAVVVYVEYRHAPEHRLPAAYDDYEEALDWVRTTGDEWIRSHADLSKCFLMGMSAGGNIVLHVGLRAAARAEELMPVKINGLILHQPFFGGVERTPSEIANSAGSKTLPLPISDLMWELALPVGADRDHGYCNAVNMNLDKIKEKGWIVAVIGCGGDTLFDRQKEVAAALEEKSVTVVAKFVEGEDHGYDIFDLSKSQLIMATVKEIANLT